MSQSQDPWQIDGGHRLAKSTHITSLGSKSKTKEFQGVVVEAAIMVVADSKWLEVSQSILLSTIQSVKVALVEGTE